MLTSALVAVALAAFQAPARVPPPAVVTRSAVTSRLAVPSVARVATRASAVMFSEPPPEEPDDDAFEELSQELTGLQRQLQKLSPLAFSAGEKTVTVLSALVAWFVTPPMGRVAALTALGVGGGAGLRMSKRMKEARRGLVPSAIADMVRRDGLDGLKPSAVAELARRYRVDAVEFEQQLSAVYARFLRQLLSESEEGGPKPVQIRELGSLRRGMGLKWNATSAVHVAEAKAFLDGEAPPPGGELPVELASLLWLSSGLFATSKRQADTADLVNALGMDERAAQRAINQISAPIYGRAVTKTVGKYNRTEAPGVLQTARRALSLSEAAAQQVHASVYTAQLAILLPDEDDACKLGEEDMELLGELEGILQVRSAGSRLQARTVPLFRASARAALEGALATAGTDAAERPVSVWGRLAVRQQELQLTTDVAKSLLVEESRRMAAERLEAAAGMQAKGDEAAALAALGGVADFSTFLGEMFTIGGLVSASETSNTIAERYLGALTLPEGVGESAQALAAAAADARPDLAPIASAMTALANPALASARAEYSSELDSLLSASEFGGAAAQRHRELCERLGLSTALAERLSLDAYYGWLVDLAETGERSRLEACEEVRSCLSIGTAAVGELYANTAVDDLVLSACCDALLEDEAPLREADAQWLYYLDGRLGARPGVASAIVSAASSA